MLPNALLTIIHCLIVIFQTRYQEFLRLGEVSQNKRTSIHISSTIHERKALDREVE